MLSSSYLPPCGVKFKEPFPDRCASLEQARANSSCLYADHLCDFRWIVSLQIDEIEHFSLPWRQRREEIANELRYSLTVYSRTWISVVDAFADRKRFRREKLAPPVLSSSLQRDSASNEVHPAFNRR